MLKLKRILFPTLVLLLFSVQSQAKSCIGFLKSDDFRHGRAWQEFALTSPVQSTSREARNQILDFYEGYIQQEVQVWAAKNGVEDKFINEIKQDLAWELNLWINARQSELYPRFENSKRYWLTDTAFARKEVTEISEIIKQTPDWLASKIEEYLNSSIP